MAPSSALPIGGTRIISEMQPVVVEPSQSGSGLLNAILALLAPPNPDESERYDEEILDLNVIGFLVMYVSSLLYLKKDPSQYSI
jgi:polyribonucleotide 5'-hydroxyl-kinase